MMELKLSRADIAVMELFLSQTFSEKNVSEVAKETGIGYRLVYESVKKLSEKGLILSKVSGKTIICSANLRADRRICAYIESIRRDKFLSRHKEIAVIAGEIEKLKSVFYSALVFGSYAKGNKKKNSDIDMLFIIPDSADAEKFEKELFSAFRALSYKIHINIAVEKDIIEMLGKPQKLNVANEALKSHIIISGAEQFYMLAGKNA